MEKKKEKEKPQEQASFFRELGSFMDPYKSLLALSVVISILGVSVQVLSYAFIGIAAGKLFGGSRDGLWLMAGLAAGCRVLSTLLVNLSTWCSHRAAYRTLRDIRTGLSSKMLRLPMGWFEENGSGRIKQLLTDQVENMEKPLAHVIPEMTADLLVPLALSVWLFILDWRLGLAVIIWMMLGFTCSAGMMRNYPEKFAGQIKRAKALNQAITEYIGGIEVIKNFGQAESASRKLEKDVYEHAEYNIGWQKETLIWSALSMAIAPFSIFPVLFFGILFWSQGTLPPADLVLASLLTMGIFGPIMNASSYFDQTAQMGTVAKEIKDILDYPELKRGNEGMPEHSDVEFKNVTFSYGKSKEPALDDVSLMVPEGTMTALVGPSGSGKSTIAKLIAGYWDAGSGEITIGGRPISSFTQEALNETVAYVEQETFLFDETIMENIRKGRPEATDEEIIESAKKAGCHEFISALPEGYQTKAGTAGKRLSGGEKQRIAILRAMMKDAPLLVLDEATASADPENEARIQEALSVITKGKTLIVVAHHLKTIVHADQICYVKDGRIEATGTHEEMLEKCPGYRKLWIESGEVTA